MSCKHNAFIEVEGGIRCMLCGVFVPSNQEAAGEAQKQPEKAAVDAGTGKSTTRKRTPKNAK